MRVNLNHTIISRLVHLHYAICTKSSHPKLIAWRERERQRERQKKQQLFSQEMGYIYMGTYIFIWIYLSDVRLLIPSMNETSSSLLELKFQWLVKFKLRGTWNFASPFSINLRDPISPSKFSSHVNNKEREWKFLWAFRLSANWN